MSKQDQSKPKLRIEAKHIGPIMELNSELSDKNQNLIFAKNGIGKSFIARALRHLDGRANTGYEDEELPKLLVSEEAEDSKGHFRLFEGDNKIGGINMGAGVPSVPRPEPKYIFHVFSQDYVDEEIRGKLDDLNGEITHEIIIGRENVELGELKTTIKTNQDNYAELKGVLIGVFETNREELKNNFGINAGLGAYRDLSIDTFLGSTPFSKIEDIPSLASLLNDYNKFKSLPIDPPIPSKVHFNFEFNFDAVSAELKKITSMSTVEESIKDKIKDNSDFFKYGLKKLDVNKEYCPLCTQELNDVGLNAIAAYRAYFEDEEAKHVSRIREVLNSVRTKVSYISEVRNANQTNKIKFDKLKAYFPSMENVNFNEITDELEKLGKYFDDLQEMLEGKIQQLDKKIEAPNFDNTIIQHIQTHLESNNRLINNLASLVNDSSNERRRLQSNACKAFLNEFANTNSIQINQLKELEAEEDVLQNKLGVLSQKYEGKASARERVAKTFSMMLERFFRNKYSFDEASFKVRHNKKEMQRGGERTLSDGEKSVIAFCYFIAQTHLRVESIEDYKKLYFVFDDPVTSLSLDYIYTIVTSLKLLCISNDGDISIKNENGWHKPKMLILTHNYYFCNLASARDFIQTNGLFQLISGQSAHKLVSQEAFATPYSSHLSDIYEVKEGKKPDHTTPNSIRFVIETIGKFLWPDSKGLKGIVKLFESKYQVEIKSTLILNDFSHGGKTENITLFEEDIKVAIKEVIEIVEKVAPGQLEKFESS